jgi:hypothetical protein
MSTLLDIVFADMEEKLRLLHQWSVTDRLLHSTVLSMSSNLGLLALGMEHVGLIDCASGQECNLHMSVVRKQQGKGNLNIIY